MLKVGIIGCGRAAARHAGALAKLEGAFQIVGCCDLDSMVLMDFRKRFCPKADVFTDASAMLIQLKMDVVVLTTWPATHRDLIMEAVEIGIPAIVVEKPLTITAGEAQEVFTIAAARNVRILESNAFIYQARFAELHALLTPDTPADTMHATFCQQDKEVVDPEEFDLDWRQLRISGGGVPWEYVSFLVTTCNHFAKDIPVGVYAYGSRGRYDTITRLHGMIEYLHGGVAFIHSDKQAQAQNFRVQLKGVTADLHDGCWYLEDGASTMTTYREGGFDARAFDDNDPFLLQWREFLACLSGDGPLPAVPFIGSVVDMYTLDALVASVLQQVPVELDVPEPILTVYEASLEGPSGT